MVWEAAKAVKIPVIGIGGISTAEDVIEFMLAGATAIEVGTVNFWDPCACETLVDSLDQVVSRAPYRQDQHPDRRAAARLIRVGWL